MESSHTAELDIPELNAAASKAHVFPGMANHSLLSVGRLCDEGYIVTFKHASVTICDSQKSQILNGPRDLDTGLWRINLKQTNNHIPELIANSPLLAQSPVQSNEICIVTGGQRRTSDHVARPNGRHYQQTFDTHAGHGHGPHELATPTH
jgi:hypothetical protein